jgi:CubicO group peptidase (beta-lactamase class C family)
MTAFRSIAIALAPAAIVLAPSPALARETAPETAPADPLDTERMIEVIETEVDTGKFMGAVLVAQGDTPVIDRAWGMADLEWDIANTTDTRFRIGSVSKQFTAVATLLLAERGQLSLDAPIATYLEDTPPAWQAVTVRNLLRHTSGIPSFTQLESFERDQYLPLSPDELIATFSALPLEFEPGAKFTYSNSGYVLLSKIVENVSGESFSDFLDANIFAPLGMENSGLDDPARILPRRTAGYSPAGDDVNVINARYNDMGIPSGAGAIYSTTHDLLKWQRGLFGGKLLSPAYLTEYLTPSKHDALGGYRYAHGILIGGEGKDRFYWHDGAINGFTAWLSHDPERDVTIAVLANLNGGAASKIGEQLTMVSQGQEVVLPADRVAIPMSREEMAEYEGVYALSPDFKLTVFLEEDRLMTQATGQGPARIYPEAKDRFFLKVIDAQLGFTRDESGAITGATLYQNGREFPAVRE